MRGEIRETESLQIVGLAAIGFFGGILIFQLTQPTKREIIERHFASISDMPFPNEAPLSFASQPTPAPPPAFPVSDPAATLGAASHPDDTMPGSQNAKDDLYCWAVLNADFDVKIETDPGKATPLLDAAKRLEAAGVKKLETDRLAKGSIVRCWPRREYAVFCADNLPWPCWRSSR